MRDDGDFSSLLKLIMPGRELADIVRERPELIKKLKSFHPIKTAAVISGLLTLPALHANTIRLELLINLIMAWSTGKKAPESIHIQSWLNKELGSTSFVHSEDPVEDVFISNVMTDEGNIRIFEGIWESSDFYLQRILNIIKTLPDEHSTRQLKREVRGILKLSEDIANRRRIARFSPGAGDDKGKIKIPSNTELKALCKVIIFKREDLHRLGVSHTDIEPFLFNLQLRSRLRDQSLDVSDLQRNPIVYDAEVWFVLLPNNISFAVRIHILDWLIKNSYQDSFDKQLDIEYKRFFSETPIMGSLFPADAFIPVQHKDGKTLMTFAREFDAGRYFQIIAVIDGITGYQQQGFTSFESDSKDGYNDKIETQIKEAQTHFRKQAGFKQGMTLVVGCGYGRANSLRLCRGSFDWPVEFISAPDLQTLAWTSETSPWALWKLIRHSQYIKQQGISIANVNGLLNLYGWWVDSNYLMLSPQVEFGKQQISIMLSTDFLAGIRQKVRQSWDLHVLPLPNNQWVQVRKKNSDSHFSDDANKPLYVCMEAACRGQLLGAMVGEKSVWWITVERGKIGLQRGMLYMVWDATHNWLGRAVPIFESVMQKLTNKTIHIILDFDNIHQAQVKQLSDSILSNSLSVSTIPEEGIIRIVFRDSFFGSFQTPENLAERGLIRALVKGTLELVGKKSCDEIVDGLVNEIVPNDDARYVHMFEATQFREQIKDLDCPRAILIDEADEALSKLGLGWLSRDRKDGDTFNTVSESTRFLNDVVEKIWHRMQVQFHTLDRVHFLEQVLRYIEGAENEKNRWQYTIRAVAALHDNKENTFSVAIKQVTRYNASTIALRLLAEMAISECPLQGGARVGQLDLVPLMSDMLYIFNLGGLSDAIKKGVMNPEIKIAPIGDILSHTSFRDDVLEPLGRQYNTEQLNYENEHYNKKFEPFRPIPTVQGVFPDAFLVAFAAEFGLSVDSLRGIRDALEDLAIKKEKCVFIVQKEEILSCCGNSEFTTKEDAEVFLKRFSLWPRSSWNSTPQGFDPRDWYPWLFGRSLSLVARPIVQLEEGDNPRYLISPGLISDGTMHTIYQYFKAEIPTLKCHSSEMKRWIDDEKSRRSHEFVEKVASIMRDLGYMAQTEIALTELLKEKNSGINYGDVDVLAWKQDRAEVLAIECKDLKFAKNPNEISEQLNHFNGQVFPNGKRDELRKHMDRCTFLNQKSPRLAQILGKADGNIFVRNVVCFSMPTPTQYMARRYPDVTFTTVNELSKIVGC